MLDDKDKVASVDRRDMLGKVGSMPDHLSEGYALGRSGDRVGGTRDSLYVCGLGGSAIGGDALCAWLKSVSRVRCEVVRGYELPRHVARGSLVMVASYSGNTEETLSMLEDARARGAEVFTISSGGRMAGSVDRARSVVVPSGMVPRASIGYVFGAMLGVAERAGVASPGDQVVECGDVLAGVKASCGPDVPTVDNPAKRLAHELHGCVPVIVGHGISAPVAKRWANQMNENAKSLAFSSELPEMDHNEIVAWSADPRGQGFAAVFLDHDLGDSRMSRRLGATVDMVRERARVHVVRATGRGPLSQMMSLVMVGDYVSVYSAVLRGEDPSTTEPIERLKSVLSKK